MLNWWLIRVEVARSINNYKACFLSRPRSSSQMSSNLIFQAICLQVLSFRLYAFKSNCSGHMPSGLRNFLLSCLLFVFQAIFQAVYLQVLSFDPFKFC